MKRFTAFCLALLIIFLPFSYSERYINSYAAEPFITYSSDWNFADYDFIFLGGTSSVTSIFMLRSNSSNNYSDKIQFFVSTDVNKTSIYFSSNSHSLDYYSHSYRIKSPFTSTEYIDYSSVYGFNFYGTDSFHIIASTADIVDQDGYTVFHADYDEFLSYFTNADKVRSVTSDYSTSEEPTSEGGSSGGNLNIDFSSLTDSLEGFFDSLNDTLNDLIDVVSSIPDNISGAVSSSFHEAVTDYLSSIDNRLANILEMILTKSLLTEYLQDIKIAVEDADTHINDYLSQINVKNGVISNTLGSILTEIQSINTTLTNFYIDFPQEIKKVTDKVGILETTLSAFLTNFNSFVTSLTSKLDNISYDIISKLNSIQVNELTAISNKLNVLSSGFQNVVNAVNGIPASIQDILEYLFIPQNNDYFKDIIDTINAKFGFIHQFIELGDVLVDNSGSFTNTPPAFKIEFKDNKYLGNVTFNLVDWSKVSDYIPYVKALTSGITLYLFIRRTWKKLPEVISGGGC